MNETKAKAKIGINGKSFVITGAYKEAIFGFPNSDDQLYHNKFVITVKRVLDNGKTSLGKRFDYYGSYADYEKGKTSLTAKDLLFAFRSFIDDAICGSETFDDFCGNMGYDTDSRTAEKIHKLCQKSLDKAYDLGIFRSELYDTLEVLSNRGIE